MAPELYHAIEQGGACLDLSSRAKFLVSGADRIRYLNGQVTNDVRRCTAQDAVYACVTSAKGRIEADMFLHVSPAGDSLLLDAEPELRETLSLRLDKYIVADDVTLTDVTDEWKLLHVFGAAVAQLDAWCSTQPEGTHRVSAVRLGEAGVDVWIPGASALSPWPGLMLGTEDAETLRILRGIPRWPHELNADSFPQEAGLEGRAMDFNKGCYIGQETLSRIKMTGKMPRHLMHWTALDGHDTPLKGPLPSALYFEDSAGVRHDAGVMTSAVRHPLLDRWVGLGYVRQAQALAHSVLLAGDGTSSICIDDKYLKA